MANTCNTLGCPGHQSWFDNSVATCSSLPSQVSLLNRPLTTTWEPLESNTGVIIFPCANICPSCVFLKEVLSTQAPRPGTWVVFPSPSIHPLRQLVNLCLLILPLELVESIPSSPPLPTTAPVRLHLDFCRGLLTDVPASTLTPFIPSPLPMP